MFRAMKQDEVLLFEWVRYMQLERRKSDYAATHLPQVRGIINHLARKGHVHPKRALRILEKWCKKGWYDYGTSIDLGWVTEKGMAVEPMFKKEDNNVQQDEGIRNACNATRMGEGEAVGKGCAGTSCKAART